MYEVMVRMYGRLVIYKRKTIDEVPEEYRKEAVEILHILFQNLIIHPAHPQGASGHPEELLHGVAEGAGKPVSKGSVADVIKPVLLPGICKGRDPCRLTEHPRRHQCRIGSAGHIQRTVRILLADGQKQP